jgi:hypothetical protein
MLDTVTCDEQRTVEGFERHLIVNQETVAIALINEHIPDFTIGWPVSQRSSPVSSSPQVTQTYLGSLLFSWLQKVLPGYDLSPRVHSLTLEFWLAGQFYTRTFAPPVDINQLFNFIRQSYVTPRDVLSLVLVNVENQILEVTLGEMQTPVQCVCTLDEMRLKTFIPFFRDFHSNVNVRTEGEVSLKAFAADSSQFPNPLNLVSPTRVVD